jgi:hypothetical protein
MPMSFGDKIYLSPLFLQNFYYENMFKLAERSYPCRFWIPSIKNVFNEPGLKQPISDVHLPKTPL